MMRQHLAHVFWIGGSPCAGKSSIAELLALRYGLRLYHVDDALGEQQARITAAVQPTLHKWTSTPWDALWMQPPGTLLAEAIACYGEHLELVLEDLLALPGTGPILVEGTCVLPDRVAGILAHRERAIWVVPTDAFQRAHYAQRGTWVEGILSQCTDPAQAFQNWMDRDAAFARWVAERVRALGLPLLEVDGRHSIAENAEWAARCLRLPGAASGSGQRP